MEIIKQVLENHSFKNFSKNQKKTCWSVIFRQILTFFFMNGYYVSSFPTFTGNSPPTTDASNMIFNGQAIDLPHNFIILIDKSSHSLDLLEFKFLINAKISSSLILREGGVLSVLSRSVGKLLEFCNWVHCDAKYLLNIVAF